MTHMIRPYIEEVNLAELARRIPKQTAPPKKEETPMQITSQENFWEIKGAVYRSETGIVRLGKQLLLNGEARTQDEWVQYSLEARAKGLLYTSDFPLLYSAIRAVENSDAPEKEEIRNFLKETARAKWLMTSTRLRYNPSGLDEIIHNFKMPDEYTERVALVGPDRIIERGDAEVCKALLGTDDIQEISDVFQWLNETPTYLWRLNKRYK